MQKSGFEKNVFLASEIKKAYAALPLNTVAVALRLSSHTPLVCPQVESELDNVRRRLDQTEGSKAALQAQVEQLRSQLSRAEQDRNRIKTDLDESRIEAEVKEQRRRRAGVFINTVKTS